MSWTHRATEDLTERSCVECGFVFQVDEGFYLERGLTPPRRCRRCRELRRAAGQSSPGARIEGQVVHLEAGRGSVWGFIASSGAKHYFTIDSVAEADRLVLAVGDTVTFEVDDRSARPRARAIRRTE